MGVPQIVLRDHRRGTVAKAAVLHRLGAPADRLGDHRVVCTAGLPVGQVSVQLGAQLVHGQPRRVGALYRSWSPFGCGQCQDGTDPPGWTENVQASRLIRALALVYCQVIRLKYRAPRCVRGVLAHTVTG